jgi:hypothetical protein
MTQPVEDIIEELMTELVNINSITVGRFVGRNRKDFPPTLVRNLFKNSEEEPLAAVLSRSCLFRESRVMEMGLPTKGMPKSMKKEPEGREKPEELRELEKSLTKLREMEK